MGSFFPVIIGSVKVISNTYVMPSMLLIIFSIISIMILFIFMKFYRNEMKKRNALQK